MTATITETYHSSAFILTFMTKAFDLVSRSGLFILIQRIGWSLKVLKMIRSFHDNMKGTVLYDGSSDPFPINSRVKQGCVLAPTLFGIFSLLLIHAFDSSDDGVYIHTKSDERLFNLSKVKAKTKMRHAYSIDAVYRPCCPCSSHRGSSSENYKQLLSSQQTLRSDHQPKETNIMAQDTGIAPNIHIDNYSSEVVSEFTYLGSSMSSNLSLKLELKRRIGKPSAAMSRLSKRVWENKKLTLSTKMKVYHMRPQHIVIR